MNYGMGYSPTTATQWIIHSAGLTLNYDLHRLLKNEQAASPVLFSNIMLKD